MKHIESARICHDLKNVKSKFFQVFFSYWQLSQTDGVNYVQKVHVNVKRLTRISPDQSLELQNYCHN